MAEIKWIKLMTDIFDHSKIRMIESMPEADTIIVIWFKLLCLSGKVNESGSLILTNDIPFTDEMLSTYFNRPVTVTRLALQTFINFGMIEIINNILCVVNWEKYQNIDGMEKIRIQNRERKRSQRDKKSLESTANTALTISQHVTGQSRDVTQQNKNKKKEKEKDKESLDDLIFGLIFDSELRLVFLEYVEHRMQIKKPMTQLAIKKAIQQLQKMTPSIDDQIQIINNSISNGWQGLFPLKDGPKQKLSEAERIMSL